MNRILTMAMVGAMTSASISHAQGKPIKVTPDNFARAETDMYFAKYVAKGSFGKLTHDRTAPSIDDQKVVRMNRDTLYSTGVFDLDAGPITIALPEVGKRFMSLQVVSEDQYTSEVDYAPSTVTIDKAKVGTRYVFTILRTLADPNNPADMDAARKAQDAIVVTQAAKGTFEIPEWDGASRDKVREALARLGELGAAPDRMFGKKDEVSPIDFVIGAATGWGGNPIYAAKYITVTPTLNDGKTPYELTVKDVPVDGFWSISVYNAKGFFEKNDLDAYSLNNLTAKQNSDGSYTIRFGGCTKASPNCLPIVAGWNYAVRLYRARKALLDGTWTFPEAKPVK